MRCCTQRSSSIKCWNGPLGEERGLGEVQESLVDLLARLDDGLRKRAIRASVRSPDLLFDELEDLNLVLELRGRIKSHKERHGGLSL